MSTKIRAFIADDNNSNRELIELYLSFFPQIEVVGSYSNGLDVLSQIEIQNPTVIFLDIEMPGLNGLTAASKIRELRPNIFIIFITAHTQYAALAFQLDATDYLVKPISKESIERSIKKIEKFLSFNTQDVKESIDIIMIRNNDETYIIHLKAIIFIEKEIRKTILHTDNGKYITTETLSSLEKKLNTNFFRCHKSFIVNIKKIEKIVPIAERIYKIEFYNYSLHASMGRKKLEELYLKI